MMLTTAQIYESRAIGVATDAEANLTSGNVPAAQALATLAVVYATLAQAAATEAAG